MTNGASGVAVREIATPICSALPSPESEFLMAVVTGLALPLMVVFSDVRLDGQETILSLKLVVALAFFRMM